MKVYLQKWQLLLLCLMASVSSLMASEDILKNAHQGVVEVRSFEDNRLLGRALGFVLDDQGHIVTYLGELERADKISVITHSGAELVAHKLLDNRDAGIAVVKINGVTDLKPLLFARQASSPGRRVYSLDLAADGALSLKLTQGSVSQILANRKAGEAGFIQHFGCLHR